MVKKLITQQIWGLLSKKEYNFIPISFFYLFYRFPWTSLSSFYHFQSITLFLTSLFLYISLSISPSIILSLSFSLKIFVYHSFSLNLSLSILISLLLSLLQPCRIHTPPTSLFYPAEQSASQLCPGRFIPASLTLHRPLPSSRQYTRHPASLWTLW